MVKSGLGSLWLGRSVGAAAIVLVGACACLLPQPVLAHATAVPVTVGDITFKADQFPPTDATLAMTPFQWSSPAPMSGEPTSVVKRWIDGVPYDMSLRQAEFGYRYLHSYHLTGNDWYLQKARAQADYLILTHATNGQGWFYPNTFLFRLDSKYAGGTLTPPWYGGIAQGTAVGLFARLWDETGDPRYKDAAEHTLESFLVRRTPGGLWTSYVDGAGYLRLEQYPGTAWTFIHNGHMQAAMGILDYYRVTGDERAMTLYEGALTSTVAYAGVLRNPGWISAYALGARAPYVSYHRRVGAQLLLFYAITGDPRFARLVSTYDDDFPLVGGAGKVFVVPGTYQVYRFNSSGAPTAATTFKPTNAWSYDFGTRTRIRGRAGHWFQLKGGWLDGYFLQEQPDRVYVRGAFGVVTFRPDVPVQLRTGTWPAWKIGANGAVTETRRLVFTSVTRDTTRTSTGASAVAASETPALKTLRTSFIRDRAVVNGVPCVRIAARPFAEFWVPQRAVILP